MLRIVACSEFDLRGELNHSVVGRHGIDLFRAGRFEDARLLATSLGAQLFLVDRDLPRAVEFVTRLREDAATRNRSIAVLARGDIEPAEFELLEAGANAILRLPPDDSWPQRLRRLLNVPMREQTRTPVELEAELAPHGPASVANLSPSGMLVESAAPLALHQEVAFRFRLPDDGAWIEGRARVVREAGAGAWGLEFVEVPEPQRRSIQDHLRSVRRD